MDSFRLPPLPIIYVPQRGNETLHERFKTFSMKCLGDTPQDPILDGLVAVSDERVSIVEDTADQTIIREGGITPSDDKEGVNVHNIWLAATERTRLPSLRVCPPPLFFFWQKGSPFHRTKGYRGTTYKRDILHCFLHKAALS